MRKKGDNARAQSSTERYSRLAALCDDLEKEIDILEKEGKNIKKILLAALDKEKQKKILNFIKKMF